MPSIAKDILESADRLTPENPQARLNAKLPARLGLDLSFSLISQ
jgi:hypothetical protein